jgi:hypothetical protein
LTAHFEKTALSEKMIEEDLSRVEESATKSTYRLGFGFEWCEDEGEKSAPKFIPSSTYHKEEATIKPTKAHYPSNPNPSFNPKREARKETKQEMKLSFACFVAVLVTWMSFASGGRELRGGVLSMLETHIMMSSLIFRLILILMFHLALTLVLCLALFHVLCLSSQVWFACSWFFWQACLCHLSHWKCFPSWFFFCSIFFKVLDFAAFFQALEVA